MVSAYFFILDLEHGEGSTNVNVPDSASSIDTSDIGVEEVSETSLNVTYLSVILANGEGFNVVVEVPLHT